MKILVPVLILLALVALFFVVNWAIQRRQMAKHDGDVEAALSDSDDSLPAAPHITDDDRPLGDTPEAHDEVSPRDIPKWDRATRAAAEEQAGGEGGETGGNVEGEGGGPAMARGGTAE
jgi:cbb3-type cytochrome oxidase maturation protein